MVNQKKIESGVRFNMLLDSQLMARIDRYKDARFFASRAEAIRQLVLQSLDRFEAEEEKRKGQAVKPVPR